jgi:hypothetical protein
LFGLLFDPDNASFGRINLSERGRWKDLAVDGIIILKWDLRGVGWGCGQNSSGSEERQVAGPSKHRNDLTSQEGLGSIELVTVSFNAFVII